MAKQLTTTAKDGAPRERIKMQKNGNSLYRHGAAMLNQSLTVVAQMEASRHGIGEQAAQAISASFKSKAQSRFDALQVGDSLQAFGVCAVVAKKNAKSVTTTSGTRYSLAELGL